MKNKLIVILILFALTACAGAQEAAAPNAPVISIRDFSKGMAPSINPFMAGNQLQECTDWHLSKRYGSLVLRNGYETVCSSSVLPGSNDDSIYINGIYGHYMSNGKKLLFGVVPEYGQSWGRLVHSYPNQYQIDTMAELAFGTDVRHVLNYMYANAQPWWTSWRDMLFMCNGIQAPIVWKDSVDTLRDYAMPLSGYTPGTSEYLVIDSGGHLNGRYWYAWSTRAVPCSASAVWSNGLAYPIGPIDVINGSIVHYNFPRTGKMSMCTNDDTLTSISLWRTKANPAIDQKTGLPGEMTTFFKMVAFDTLTPMQCAEISWTDSIPDTSLGTAPYDTSGIYEEFPLYINGMPGIASTKAFNNGTGKATYFAQNKVDTVIYYGVTFLDTLLDLESCMGKINKLTLSSTDTNVALYLPPVPSHMKNTVRVLYRGWDVYSFDADSVILQPSGMNRLSGAIYIQSVIKYIDINPSLQLRTFYPVDTIAMPVDTVTDEMKYEDLILRKPYEPNAVQKFEGMVAVGDRMWAWEGSKLYFSDLDTATRWGAFQYVSFNLDDGEDITVVVPNRSDLVVYKPSNSFILYQDNDGGFTRSWMIPAIGCVSKFSMVAVGDARFYLAMDGFYQEQGLPYKDRGASIKKISLPVQNILDRWTLAEKKGCYAFRNGDEVWFSFSQKDTTLVYNMITEAWALVDYAVKQATTYDTLEATRHYRSDKILFIKDMGSDINLLDTGDIALKGSPKVTLPRLIFDDYYGINQIKLWTRHANDSGGIKIIITDPVGGEADTLMQETPISDLMVFRGMNVSGYMLDVSIIPYGYKVVNPSGGGDSVFVFIRDFEINGIDIWAEKKATVESE